MSSSRAPASLASVSMSNGTVRTHSPPIHPETHLFEQMLPKPVLLPTPSPLIKNHIPVSADHRDLSPHEDSFKYAFGQQVKVYVPGSPEEKQLVRLIDFHIAHHTQYPLSNLLRSRQIGNAKIGGMADDLQLSSSGYSVAVLIFFVGYLLAEIPSNMLLTRVRPSLFIPLITFSWGLVATCLAAVESKEGLAAVRFVLGFVEAGFFPGVVYLLSSWYRKSELAKRIGFLFTAGQLSGAFGGVISGAVIEGLDQVRGIRGWRWLFISWVIKSHRLMDCLQFALTNKSTCNDMHFSVEGMMTLATSVVVVFFLPDWPSDTKWLSPEQQALAVARLAAEQPSESEKRAPLTHMQAFKAAIADWRTFVFAFLYLMILSATSISYFLPTITVALGYTGQMAQFMTVPFYICACVAVLAVSLSADYFKDRVSHVTIPTAIAGIMFAVCGATSNTSARYGLICIGFAANYSCLPVVLAWLSRELGYPNEKRAVCTALVNTIGNCASIYGSFLWSQGPKFLLGFGATSAFCFSAAITGFIGNILFNRYPPIGNLGFKNHDGYSLQANTSHYRNKFNLVTESGEFKNQPKA